jgi:hypothetical protein
MDLVVLPSKNRRSFIITHHRGHVWLIGRPRAIAAGAEIQRIRNMAQKKRTTRAQVVTLADLAPQHDVSGGSQRRVFGSDPIDPSRPDRRGDVKPSNASAKKAKDLPAKSAVKGGGHNLNDNITLTRAAKAGHKAKDLAPKTPGRVKGGGNESPEKLSANDNVTLVRAAR